VNEEQGRDVRKWIDEAEEALSRTAEALRTAWNDTKEARMATLEAAKEAAARLGKAIDQGIDAARENWDSAERQGPTSAGSTEADRPQATPSEIHEEE
jgi:hypothetical protein